MLRHATARASDHAERNDVTMVSRLTDAVGNFGISYPTGEYELEVQRG
jgi:hypothetical protein